MKSQNQKMASRMPATGAKTNLHRKQERKRGAGENNSAARGLVDGPALPFILSQDVDDHMSKHQAEAATRDL